MKDYWENNRINVRIGRFLTRPVYFYGFILVAEMFFFLITDTLILTYIKRKLNIRNIEC